MTILFIEELRAGVLSQVYTATQRLAITAIRPHIYKQRSPAGIFTLTLKSGATTLGSVSTTSAAIESTTTSTNINFFHGHLSFQFTNPIIVNRGSFLIELSASGYTFTENDYFGWVKPHENKYITESYTAADDSQNSFGIQIWVQGKEGAVSRILDISDGFTSATVPSVTASVPSITSTFASPSLVVAATGIVINDVAAEVIFIAHDGGGGDISVNPQIPVPTQAGSVLTLIGGTGTNEVLLEDGNGLDLDASWTGFSNATLNLIFADGLWREDSRSA